MIASQLQLRTVADVGDLEDAIRGGSAEITKSTEKTTYHKSKSGEEFSVGDFTDNFYPGEIKVVETEYITADFLRPVVLKQNHVG